MENYTKLDIELEEKLASYLQFEDESHTMHWRLFWEMKRELIRETEREILHELSQTFYELFF